MRSRIIAAVAAALGLAAALDVNASIVTETSTIVRLSPLADGRYVIGVTGSFAGCDQSGSVRYLYITIGQSGVTADGAKNLIATALLAFSAERTISIAYDNSSAYCFVQSLNVS
jgi:hypothetical protein